MGNTIKSKAELNEAMGNMAVAVYFHSQDCSVCTSLLPQVEYLLNANFPRVTLYVINANESKELCASLTVFTFPTLLIYFEGKESLRLARNINLAALKKTLERPYQLLFS